MSRNHYQVLNYLSKLVLSCFILTSNSGCGRHHTDCDGEAHGSTQTRLRYKHSLGFSNDPCESEQQTRSCDNGNWTLWNGNPYLHHDSCQNFMTKASTIEDEDLLLNPNNNVILPYSLFFDNYIYALNDHDGFVVIDVSDPKNPQKKAPLLLAINNDPQATHKKLFFVNNYAYVFTSYTYLDPKTKLPQTTTAITPIDFKDPAQPRIGQTSNYLHTQLPQNLENFPWTIYQHYLVTFSPADQKLIMLDFKDPQTPILKISKLSWLNPNANYLEKVAIKDSYLYITSYSTNTKAGKTALKFHLVDLKKPDNPQKVPKKITIATDIIPYDHENNLLMTDNYFYIVGEKNYYNSPTEQRLLTFKIGNPLEISLLQTHEIGTIEQNVNFRFYDDYLHIFNIIPDPQANNHMMLAVTSIDLYNPSLTYNSKRQIISITQGGRLIVPMRIQGHHLYELYAQIVPANKTIIGVDIWTE